MREPWSKTGAQRLYYDSPELRFTAEVTDIRLQSQTTGEDGSKEQLWQVALDRTAFYPESGGQPWDTGVLTAVARSGSALEVAVERVEEDEAGEVWHFVRKPLVVGTEVTGHVHAARRMDHMQQHSGQHLLSAVFLAELEAGTVSFHLGQESSTIDLALRESAEKLSHDDLLAVQAKVNELIFEDRSLQPFWRSPEEAREMLARGELRKLPEREGPIRVVAMQGVEFNACGGTHVASTGAIGGVLLRRVEKVKQGWRVEFVCGARAVRAARKDFETLTAVAGRLSVGADDVPARVATLLEDAKTAAKEKRALLQELAEAEATRLVTSATPGLVVRAVFAERDVEFAKRVASRLSATGHAAVVGATQRSDGAVVLAKAAGTEFHAGNTLREVMATAGARGGGGADLAQGVCRADQVSALIDELIARIA